MPRLTVALCLGLMACPKTTPPAAGTSAPTAADATTPLASAPPPPVVPPAANPLRGPHPPESDAPNTPPIAGDPQGRDVERLARSRLTYTLSTDAPVLGALAELPTHALLEALSADPRWRVGFSGGTALACRRPPEGTGPGPGSYFAEASVPGAAPHRLFRACVRFGTRGSDHPWSTSPLVSHNTHQQRDLKVAATTLDAAPYAGWQSAALTIDGPEISVELHEVAPQLDMARTSAQLSDLHARVASLVAAAVRDNPQRAAQATLPPGEPRLAAPALRCLRLADGSLRVDGGVNPSTPAWVWARPIGADGLPIGGLEAAVAAATLERTGGSADTGTVWSWQSTVPAAAAAPVRGLELWSVTGPESTPIRLHPQLVAACP